MKDIASVRKNGSQSVAFKKGPKFAHQDVPFLLEHVLPHLLRSRIDTYCMSTKALPGSASETFYKNTPLFEVKKVSKICLKCSKLPLFGQRKRCPHIEVPDQPNQDDSLRKVIGMYMPPEIEAAELYGDRYIPPSHLFDEE